MVIGEVMRIKGTNKRVVVVNKLGHNHMGGIVVVRPDEGEPQLMFIVREHLTKEGLQ